MYLNGDRYLLYGGGWIHHLPPPSRPSLAIASALRQTRASLGLPTIPVEILPLYRFPHAVAPTQCTLSEDTRLFEESKPLGDVGLPTLRRLSLRRAPEKPA